MAGNTSAAQPESQAPVTWIEKTPGVCGGEARIRRTRIPVWLLVEIRQGGGSDAEILVDYPLLTPADLAAAWEYYDRNRQEIEAAITRQQQA